jgi:hypothetical protein
MEEGYIIYESFYYSNEYMYDGQWFGRTIKMRTKGKGSYFK